MVIIFLPYPDMERSVRCLDRSRINKQKLEARQIISALEGRIEGWKNHPAILMWKGHEDMIKTYFNLCIDECIRRGYSNTMDKMDVSSYDLPWWWGWEEFHRSHQASLIRKHPCFYTPIFSDIDSRYLDKGYIWPSKFDSSIISNTPDSAFAPINKDTMKSADKSKDLMYTVVELRLMCREKGIRGYSKMKKSDMMNILDL